MKFFRASFSAIFRGVFGKNSKIYLPSIKNKSSGGFKVYNL